VCGFSLLNYFFYQLILYRDGLWSALCCKNIFFPLRERLRVLFGKVSSEIRDAGPRTTDYRTCWRFKQNCCAAEEAATTNSQRGDCGTESWPGPSAGRAEGSFGCRSGPSGLPLAVEQSGGPWPRFLFTKLAIGACAPSWNTQPKASGAPERTLAEGKRWRPEAEPENPRLLSFTTWWISFRSRLPFVYVLCLHSRTNGKLETRGCPWKPVKKG